MFLSDDKTSEFDDVISNVVKPDKIDYIKKVRMVIKDDTCTIQKKLLIIRDFAKDHQNSGSVVRALSDIRKSLENTDIPFEVRYELSLKEYEFPEVLIAITYDIFDKNPRTISTAMGLIAKFLKLLDKQEKSRIIKTLIERLQSCEHSELSIFWGYVLAKIFKCKVKLPDNENSNNSHDEKTSLCSVLKGDGKVKVSDFWGFNFLNNEDVINEINQVQLVDFTDERLTTCVEMDNTELFVTPPSLPSSPSPAQLVKEKKVNDLINEYLRDHPLPNRGTQPEELGDDTLASTEKESVNEHGYTSEEQAQMDKWTKELEAADRNFSGKAYLDEFYESLGLSKQEDAESVDDESLEAVTKS